MESTKLGVSLFNITGGEDKTLVEVNEASSIIHGEANPDGNIIFTFGAVVDARITGKMKIAVIATGFQRAGSALDSRRQVLDACSAGVSKQVPAGRLDSTSIVRQNV